MVDSVSKNMVLNDNNSLDIPYVPVLFLFYVMLALNRLHYDRVLPLLLLVMKQEFPQYEWVTAQEAIDMNIGSIKDSMRAIQFPMAIHNNLHFYQ